MAAISWDDSYHGSLRALAGDKVLLFVGARAVVHDGEGRVLLIRRSDNRHWALPAGAMELGESIEDCAAREMYEETGLVANGLTPFSMHTGGRYTFTNEWGHTYQLFSTSFLVGTWSGELLRVTDETIDAAFFDPAALPEPLSRSVPEVLVDLAEFESSGRIVIK